MLVRDKYKYALGAATAANFLNNTCLVGSVFEPVYSYAGRVVACPKGGQRRHHLYDNHSDTVDLWSSSGGTLYTPPLCLSESRHELII